MKFIEHLIEENKKLYKDNQVLSCAIKNQDQLIKKLKEEKVDDSYIRYLENMYDAVLAIIYEVHITKAGDTESLIELFGKISSYAVNSALGIPLDGLLGREVELGEDILSSIQEGLSEEVNSLSFNEDNIKNVILRLNFNDRNLH